MYDDYRCLACGCFLGTVDTSTEAGENWDYICNNDNCLSNLQFKKESTMRECDVRTPEQALAYILDCTLATVSSMAMLKSRKKSEFHRQIRIAQKALNWAVAMKVDISSTRADKIVKEFESSVEQWVKPYIVK